MLQSVSSVFVLYRRKTLTGSPNPMHANGTDKTLQNWWRIQPVGSVHRRKTQGEADTPQTKSQGKHIAQKKEKLKNPSERDKETLQAQVKGQGNFFYMCIIRTRSKDRVDILYVYYQAQVKGQGRYFICILTGPGQRIGHTTIETSR